MKSLLATALAILAGFMATPNTAEAGIHISVGSGHTYVSGHASCGCPIYTQRVIRSYDCYNRPIYSYYRQPFNCNCRRTVYRQPVCRQAVPQRSHFSSRTSYVSPRYTQSRNSFQGQSCQQPTRGHRYRGR